MKNNKKWGKIVALMMLCVLCIAGCGKEKEGQQVQTNQKKHRIVCTTFPQYDWVMEILGEKSSEYEVSYLTDNGADLHSYQVTAEDIAEISTCDLFIYVGGESDGWVKETLEKSLNPNRKVISFMEALGEKVKEEEIVAGMEHDHDHEEEQETKKDEHVWLSLRYAKTLVQYITTAVVEFDAENKGMYEANSKAYCDKLDALDQKYEKTVEQSEDKAVLFGDRFPFRYLMDDYGITYFAAFPGCSAETEASFETVIFLAGKTDEMGLGTILIIDHSDEKLAQTIIENSKSKDQEIRNLVSMQEIKKEDVEAGVTYLSIMEENLEVLKEAMK